MRSNLQSMYDQTKAGGSAVSGLDDSVNKRIAEKLDPKVQSEVQQWLQQVLDYGKVADEYPAYAGDFQKWLQDGRILCYALNVIMPGSVKTVHQSSIAFRQRENIEKYLKVLETRLYMSGGDMFPVDYLFEGKNMAAVVSNLAVVGNLAHYVEGYAGPALGPKAKSNPLTAMKARADRAAVSQKAQDASSPFAVYVRAPLMDTTDTADQSPRSQNAFGARRELGGNRRGAGADVASLETDVETQKEFKYPTGVERKVRQWIEQVLDQPLAGEFGDAMKSGTVLLRLLCKLHGDKPVLGSEKIYDGPIAFKQMANINLYLNRVRSLFNLSDTDLFETVDLFNQSNLISVLSHLVCLADHVKKQLPQFPVLEDVSKEMTLFSSSLHPSTAAGNQTDTSLFQAEIDALDQSEVADMTDWVNQFFVDRRSGTRKGGAAVSFAGTARKSFFVGDQSFLDDDDDDDSDDDDDDADEKKKPEAGQQRVVNLFTDLKDGTVFLDILQQLTGGVGVRFYHKTATTLFQQMQNATTLVNATDRPANVKARDLVQGSPAATMNMLRFLRERYDYEFLFRREVGDDEAVDAIVEEGEQQQTSTTDQSRDGAVDDEALLMPAAASPDDLQIVDIDKEEEGQEEEEEEVEEEAVDKEHQETGFTAAAETTSTTENAETAEEQEKEDRKEGEGEGSTDQQQQQQQQQQQENAARLKERERELEPLKHKEKLLLEQLDRLDQRNDNEKARQALDAAQAKLKEGQAALDYAQSTLKQETDLYTKAQQELDEAAKKKSIFGGGGRKKKAKEAVAEAQVHMETAQAAVNQHLANLRTLKQAVASCKEDLDQLQQRRPNLELQLKALQSEIQATVNRHDQTAKQQQHKQQSSGPNEEKQQAAAEKKVEQKQQQNQPEEHHVPQQKKGLQRAPSSIKKKPSKAKLTPTTRNCAWCRVHKAKAKVSITNTSSAAGTGGSTEPVLLCSDCIIAAGLPRYTTGWMIKRGQRRWFALDCFHQKLFWFKKEIDQFKDALPSAVNDISLVGYRVYWNDLPVKEIAADKPANINNENPLIVLDSSQKSYKLTVENVNNIKQWAIALDAGARGIYVTAYRGRKGKTQTIRSTTTSSSLIDQLLEQEKRKKKAEQALIELEKEQQQAEQESTATAQKCSSESAQRQSYVTPAQQMKVSAAYDVVRTQIAQELLNTEKTYVESMELILKEVKEPAIKSGALTEKEAGLIFMNLHEIMKYQRPFYEELKAVVDEWSPQSCIGRLFVPQRLNFLRFYTDYLSGYDHAAIATFVLAKKSAAFASLLDEFNQTGLDLAGYLVQPVQRIPRYLLLLQQMQKYTAPAHDDSPAVALAIQTISQKMKLLNQGIESGVGLEAQRLMKLDKQFVNLETSTTNTDQYKPVMHGTLVSLGRRLLRQGRIDVVSTSAQGVPSVKYAYFFLFPDCLVFAEVDDPLALSSTDNKRSKKKADKPCFTLHSVIAMDSVTACERKQEPENSLVLITVSSTWMLRGLNAIDAHAWHSLINELKQLKEELNQFGVSDIEGIKEKSELVDLLIRTKHQRWTSGGHLNKAGNWFEQHFKQPTQEEKYTEKMAQQLLSPFKKWLEYKELQKNAPEDKDDVRTRMQVQFQRLIDDPLITSSVSDNLKQCQQQGENKKELTVDFTKLEKLLLEGLEACESLYFVHGILQDIQPVLKNIESIESLLYFTVGNLHKKSLFIKQCKAQFLSLLGNHKKAISLIEAILSLQRDQPQFYHEYTRSLGVYAKLLEHAGELDRSIQIYNEQFERPMADKTAISLNLNRIRKPVPTTGSQDWKSKLASFDTNDYLSEFIEYCNAFRQRLVKQVKPLKSLDFPQLVDFRLSNPDATLAVDIDKDPKFPYGEHYGRINDHVNVLIGQGKNSTTSYYKYLIKQVRAGYYTLCEHLHSQFKTSRPEDFDNDFHDFLVCLSTGLNPSKEKKNQVYPEHYLMLFTDLNQEFYEAHEKSANELEILVNESKSKNQTKECLIYYNILISTYIKFGDHSHEEQHSNAIAKKKIIEALQFVIEQRLFDEDALEYTLSFLVQFAVVLKHENLFSNATRVDQATKNENTYFALRTMEAVITSVQQVYQRHPIMYSMICTLASIYIECCFDAEMGIKLYIIGCSGLLHTLGFVSLWTCRSVMHLAVALHRTDQTEEAKQLLEHVIAASCVKQSFALSPKTQDFHTVREAALQYRAMGGNIKLSLEETDDKTGANVKTFDQKKEPETVKVSDASSSSTTVATPPIDADQAGGGGDYVNWSVDRVCEWLADLSLSKDYSESFKEHKIDGKALFQGSRGIGKATLKKLGVKKLGDQIKVERAVGKFL